MNKESVLRAHQSRFIADNPNKAILVWSPRSGKSKAAEEWMKHPLRGDNKFFVCLKKNKKEWQARCPDATVWTKEEFKKYFDTIKNPTAIGVDEIHFFHSPLFVSKKRSQLATCLYQLVKKYPNMHLLGLTGTPLTNDPASVHTALTYIGKYIEWNQFRDKFYNLEYKPFIPYPAYFPVKNWRAMANELLIKYTDIVSLHDCVDYLPEEIKEVVEIKTKPKKYEEDEAKTWITDHKHEQSEKADFIKDLGYKYRKILLVCHYKDQIDDLAKKLKTQKEVYVIDGRTKNQEDIIKKAQEDSDCYLICQASMGAGFDGYSFDIMVFSSMAHTVRDHTQMVSRLITVEKHLMKPLIYYYLLGGKWDKHIYKSVMSGEDFNIHKYKEYND